MTEEQFEHIERYLDGQISESESKEMETRLANESGWREALELYQQSKKALEQAAFENQKQHIRNLDQSRDNFQWNTLLKVAAVVAILLLPLFYFVPTAPSYADIANEYLDPFPDRISTMGQTNSLASAMEAYNNQEYLKAVEYFQEIKLEQIDPLAQLYEGVSYLSLDSCVKARAVLEPLVGEQSTLNEVAVWYLILCDLQCDEPGPAMTKLKAYLEKENFHFNQSKAKALLERLEEMEL